ncbi:PD-(D/E)XK motif protein [Achromobacter denitrificans]|uniref:PD-(D/E)XK motif protein n=1 Tax=Achromobacter denitrificans TaxID=32002 RepID=UPI000F67FCDF|nr:PD-(D/E)XK motif protein [Achromobacter denitrificans]RSE90423.1 PD-(D/E)XK motif protein [Achromobacter denitrificans]
MARPSEEFLLAWSSLSADDSVPGWQVIPLPLAGPVSVQAGRRSPDNAEAILLSFPSARLAPTERLPEGQGFSVERADSEGALQLRLALTRRTAGGAELFATMVCDVVGALDEAALTGAAEGKLLQVFLGRVGAWQEFMRKGSQLLSPEAEVGLVGELTLLRTIIDAGLPAISVIESWVGPLDGIHDFEIGTGALEVKATLSTAGFPAKIGSLEQLDDAVRQPLFIAGTQLQQVETGQSLPELLEDLGNVVAGDAEAMRLLSERLIAAGYFDAHKDRYIRRFKLVDILVVEVKDGFPRLTPGNVPLGVTKATYEIDLIKAAGPSIPAFDALKKLGVI